MTIIDGKFQLAGLNPEYYASEREKEVAKAMALTIKSSNVEKVQGSDILTAFLSTRVREAERINGQPISVKIQNMFFAPTGIVCDAPGFDTYYKNFTMKKGMGLGIKVFSHDTTEILTAKNQNVNIMEKDLQDLMSVQKLYVNRYLPNIRLLALITGHSNTAVPSTQATVSTDDSYERAFGWIHGEDISDFMPSVKGMTHANHFRVKAGDDLDIKDIHDIVDLLTSYNSYSGEGIVALASSRTISNLGDLYQTNEYRDGVLVEGVKTPVIKGVEFLEVSQLNNEFIIFLDKGKSDILLKCVNPDVNQRGLKLLDELDREKYKFSDGLPKGMKAHVFEEEYIVVDRVGGAILDIAPSRKHASQEMQTESLTALSNYAKLVEEMYKKVV